LLFYTALYYPGSKKGKREKKRTDDAWSSIVAPLRHPNFSSLFLFTDETEHGFFLSFLILLFVALDITKFYWVVHFSGQDVKDIMGQQLQHKQEEEEGSRVI